RLDQARRPLNIAEQEGDRPAWKPAHAAAPERIVGLHAPQQRQTAAAPPPAAVTPAADAPGPGWRRAARAPSARPRGAPAATTRPSPRHAASRVSQPNGDRPQPPTNQVRPPCYPAPSQADPPAAQRNRPNHHPTPPPR